MSRLTKWFSCLNIFWHWPILSFLALQVTAILALDRPTPFHLTVCILVLLAISGLFLYRKKYVLYGLLVGATAFSLTLHFILQKPLSRGVDSQNAVYKAVLAKEGFVLAGTSYYVADLQERVDPVPDKVSGRVHLAVLGDCDFSPGSQIQFQAEITAPEGYHNPGVFNYEDFLRRQNIWGKAFVADCQSVTVLQAKAWSGFAGLRHDFLRKIFDGKIQNPDVIAALLLGTNTIDADKNTKIREAGLSHLFVISGLHFAIMSAMVFFATRKVVDFFPRLFLRVPRQKICSAVTLLFVVFYTCLTVHNPSIFRSAVTIGFYLLAVILEKQKNLLHVVLLSMAVSLIFYPLELFHLGFQLSYLCVLTLVLVAPRQWQWIQTRKIFRNFSPKTMLVIKLAWITWLMNLMLLPLVLYDFGDVSLNGFIQNLWAIPYFEFLVMPVGFLYLLTALLHLPMAPHILQLWDGTIQWFWLLYDYFSALQLPHVAGFKPHALHLWIFYSGLFLYFYNKRRWIGAATLGLLVLAFGYTYYQNRLSYDVRITQIDVGQGDAVLLQTPQKNILVDAGGHPFRDVGARVVLPVLQYLWVERLDVVIITHADADHYKGLFGLVGRVPIGEVWVGDLTNADPDYQALLQTLTQNQIPILVKKPSDVLLAPAGAEIQILSPGLQDSVLASDNDRSLVFRLQADGFSALFTGDISQAAEKALVQSYGEGLKSDYLKVAHHGSRFSSSSLFLAYAAPTYAGIGVKKNSRFGHPAPDALARLKAYHAHILRTDQDGQIQITVRDRAVSVKTFDEQWL